MEKVCAVDDNALCELVSSRDVLWQTVFFFFASHSRNIVYIRA